MGWRAAKVVTFVKDQLSMAFQEINRPKVSLRDWQDDANKKCLGAFADGKHVWVQETVTGGGKTIFGRETALDLYQSAMVDLVIILVPSLGVQSGWLNTFRGSLNATAGPNYQVDTQVWVGTYAGYKAICNALAVRRTKGYLLIVDEYHHAEREAYWGQGVSALGAGASYVLMLSGTPWRTKGTIALLEDERNIHNHPYYGEDGTVEPDHYYRYADDLISDTRGTVPIHFIFGDATAKDRQTGQEYFLPVDPDNWQQFADESCKEPLGKYVCITDSKKTLNPHLEGRRMHKELIAQGLQHLELSRAEIYRASGARDVSIMHIACASINDASSVEAYISHYYPGTKVEKIVSDEPGSTKRIEEIQRACRQNSMDRPDVIVSVGMISEGVDIPAIKVTVYFNKIMTLLYMIQLIGRGQRRIWLDEKQGYADQDELIDQTPSYFLSPAHPYIMWMATEIEKHIKQARQELDQAPDKSNDEKGKKERLLPEYDVTTTGDTLHIYHGEPVAGDKIKLMGVADRLIDHPSAKKYGLNTMWGNYINSLIIDSNGKLAEEEIKSKCKLVGIDFEKASSPIAIKEELSYDERSKLLSEEAHSLVQSIRHGIEPFVRLEDGQAYRKVWAKLNTLAGIKNFGQATLSEKQKWLYVARAWKVEQIKVAA
jgi:superfamily II DNA or RNA helicase